MNFDNEKGYNIVFCVDDKYSEYIKVPILSILNNNPDSQINIYILTDCISKRNIKNLQALKSISSQLNLFIIKVDDTVLKSLPTTKNWTIHTWYRFLIPQYIDKSISKILYLDADTLVAGSLRDLFNINLDNKSIAATPEANFFNSEFYQRLGYDKRKGYICAGVMLMNLDYWRDNKIAEKAIKWAKINKNQLKLLDQDVLNYICMDSKIILPLKYGIVQWYFTINDFYSHSFLSQLKECLTNPMVIHYASTPPWIKESQIHLFHDYWIKYNKKLAHPIKPKYKAKGLLKFKLIIWDILYPNKKRLNISIEEIKKKLYTELVSVNEQ